MEKIRVPSHSFHCMMRKARAIHFKIPRKEVSQYFTEQAVIVLKILVLENSWTETNSSMRELGKEKVSMKKWIPLVMIRMRFMKNVVLLRLVNPKDSRTDYLRSVLVVR